MEVSSTEEDGFFREWAPYTKLLSKIPARFLNGLFAQELNFTSIDVIDEYLAIGTNAGFIYWISRKKHNVQKLKCESSQTISFVKIVSTVDFMVAAGNKVGQVVIFQIPKEHPESVPESLKPKIERKVERYTVHELHQSEITFIEWSKNGMKLFSGDKSGIVVVTEIDFYMHLCKSIEIVNETYEIVQMSYYHNSLLVSSVYRTILCLKKDSKWEITQVGKKERKSLCKLGSIFNFNCENPLKVTAYCARPGLRIWKADKEGNVLQTLLFKDAISNPCGFVELLNPATRKSNIINKECNFGPIFILKDNYLVTHNGDYLYVLDPRTLTAVVVVDELRKITSLAVNKDEIFILEGARSIVRLAYAPESENIVPVENLMTKSLTNTLQYAVETVQSLAFDTPALFLSTLVDSDEEKLNGETIQHAEECFELPPVKNLPFEIDARILSPNGSEAVSCDEDKFNGLFHRSDRSTNNDSPEAAKQMSIELRKKFDLYEKINKKEFEKDLIHSTKRNKRKEITVINNLPFKQEHVIFKELEEGKSVSIKSDIPVMSHSHDGGLLPDDRSPDTIEKEIEDKEKLLAKILNLEPITIVSPSCYLPKDNLLFRSDNIDKGNDVFIRNLVNVDVEDLIEDMPNNKVENNNAFYIEPLPESVSIPSTWNLQKLKIDSQPIEIANSSGVEPLSPDDLLDNEWEVV